MRVPLVVRGPKMRRSAVATLHAGIRRADPPWTAHPFRPRRARLQQTGHNPAETADDEHEADRQRHTHYRFALKPQPVDPRQFLYPIDQAVHRLFAAPRRRRAAPVVGQTRQPRIVSPAIR